MSKLSQVTKVKYEIGQTYVKWMCQGHEVAIQTKDGIRQVFVHEEQNCLLILTGTRPGNVDRDRIFIFNSLGAKELSLRPPSGYSFGYIEDHYDYGISVVCGVVLRNDNSAWTDWYFSIDTVSGILEKCGPSY